MNPCPLLSLEGSALAAPISLPSKRTHLGPRVPARRNVGPDLASLVPEHKYLLEHWLLGGEGTKGAGILGPVLLPPQPDLAPGEQQTQVRLVPFQGNPLPRLPHVPGTSLCPRVPGISGGRVLGRWLQAEAMGARGRHAYQPSPRAAGEGAVDLRVGPSCVTLFMSVSPLGRLPHCRMGAVS